MLYAATVFLSAFLLFQIQPVIAKQILPWFGGAAAVWIICLVFFQVMLLLGYLYADLLIRIRSVRWQGGIHAVLLAASVLWLPPTAAPAWKPVDAGRPGLHIVALLLVTIGLPYLMLATTAPLAQAWFGRRHRGGLPYRLYSVSNLAALIGLGAYPFVLEPALATRAQALWWSGGYGVFALLCAAMAIQTACGESASAAVRVGEAEGGSPAMADWLSYLALSAAPAVLLLTVTYYLTEHVASVPLLWLLPLSLYLLSFILCFGFEKVHLHLGHLRLVAIGFAGLAYVLWHSGIAGHAELVVGVFSLGLFLACMFAHGELVRSKPHPRYLTGFYMMVALGGAMGGLFVSVVAPVLFRSYFELSAVVVVLAVMTLLLLRRASRQAKIRLLAASLLLAVMLGLLVRSFVNGSLAAGRNFYGGVRVADLPSVRNGEKVRVMANGSVDHGRQFLTEELRRIPTTYYGRASGIGLLLENLPRWPVRVGLIGLGTGTLATYGRPGDTYRFYEINPLVVEYARQYFRYLDDSRARTEVVMGDGRLLLERERPQGFDVLVVDAFSGGSIPVHLLTKEAFGVYFSHLKADGILALHLTNRAVDLTGVVARGAVELGATGVVVSDPGAAESETFQSIWVLLARRPHLLESPELRAVARPLMVGVDLRAWTDDYSNLFEVLR